MSQFSHSFEDGFHVVRNGHGVVILRFKHRVPKISKKKFREYLNVTYPDRDRYTVNGGGRVYGATKRPYGDYLYAQDRDKFNAEYAEWAAGHSATKETP